MKKNMGIIDRSIRIILAAAVAVLYFTGIINGTIAIVLGVFALVFVLTSSVGYCPAYAPFKLSTIKKKE